MKIRSSRFGNGVRNIWGSRWRWIRLFYLLIFVLGLLFFAALLTWELYVDLILTPQQSGPSRNYVNFTAAVLAPLAILALTAGMALLQGEGHEEDARELVLAGQYYFLGSIVFLIISGLQFIYQDQQAAPPWLLGILLLLAVGIFFLLGLLATATAFLRTMVVLLKLPLLRDATKAFNHFMDFMKGDEQK